MRLHLYVIKSSFKKCQISIGNSHIWGHILDKVNAYVWSSDGYGLIIFIVLRHEMGLTMTS